MGKALGPELATEKLEETPSRRDDDEADTRNPAINPDSALTSKPVIVTHPGGLAAHSKAQSSNVAFGVRKGANGPPDRSLRDGCCVFLFGGAVLDFIREFSYG